MRSGIIRNADFGAVSYISFANTYFPIIIIVFTHSFSLQQVGFMSRDTLIVQPKLSVYLAVLFPKDLSEILSLNDHTYCYYT